jgi:hypothetical protein
MGTVGDAFDNAMAESFFASLECELIDRKTFKTRTEAPESVHLDRRLVQPQALQRAGISFTHQLRKEIDLYS